MVHCTRVYSEHGVATPSTSNWGHTLTTELIPTHPEGAAAQRMGEIPGIQFTPGVTVCFEADGAPGPEAAGGIVVLVGAVIDPEKAQMFWAETAELCHLCQQADGFIRFLGFGDGPCSYALSFWETAEQAVAFAQDRAHRKAVATQFRDRNLYSQFAGVWTAHTVRPRRIFCECGSATTAPADTCSKCGASLNDPFSAKSKPPGIGDGGAGPP